MTSVSFSRNQEANNNEGNSTHATGEFFPRTDKNSELIDNRDTKKASEVSSTKQRQDEKLNEIELDFETNYLVERAQIKSKKAELELEIKQLKMRP